jgi:peroxiredoxin
LIIFNLQEKMITIISKFASLKITRPEMHKEKLITLLPVCICLLLLVGCHPPPKDTATISGQFMKASHARLMLYQLLPDSTPLLDSTYTDESGNFTFNVLPQEASFFLIRQSPVNYFIVAAKKGEKIRIEANGQDIRNTYKVTGSDESEVLWKYNSIAARNQHKMDSLSQVLKESQSLNDFPVIRNQLDSAFRVLYEKNRGEVISFLREYPSSLSAVIIMNQTFGGTPTVTLENDFTLFLTIDSALDKKYHTNRNYTAFHAMVNKNRANEAKRNKNQGSLPMGTKATDIALPDAQGKMKKLSLQKGKMTLVYFWASWNAQSREINNSLTGIYEQFHAKGFEIFSVSLDQDRTSWMSALQRDRTSWIQVNDSNGLKSGYAQNFRISNLPAAVLIDREGIVISGEIKLPELKALLLEKL